MTFWPSSIRKWASSRTQYVEKDVVHILIDLLPTHLNMGHSASTRRFPSWDSVSAKKCHTNRFVVKLVNLLDAPHTFSTHLLSSSDLVHLESARWAPIPLEDASYCDEPWASFGSRKIMQCQQVLLCLRHGKVTRQPHAFFPSTWWRSEGAVSGRHASNRLL